jgi:hypothetical protein
MKFPILLLCASALAATASAAPLCTASPGAWCEATVGDAGAFPKTGQATVGTGAVNSIIGYIGNGTAGSDLYSIVIQNTSQFSATFAAYTANGATGESNAAIYLFNSQGRGIEAADEGTALTGFNSFSGIYYIGIVPDGNAPEYTVGANAFPIFTSLTNGQISLPVAGAGTIDRYSRNGCGVNCQGAYEIALNGAQYSNLPEPGSLALLGTAMSAFSLLCRVKPRKSS